MNLFFFLLLGFQAFKGFRSTGQQRQVFSGATVALCRGCEEQLGTPSTIAKPLRPV